MKNIFNVVYFGRLYNINYDVKALNIFYNILNIRFRVSTSTHINILFFLFFLDETLKTL